MFRANDQIMRAAAIHRNFIFVVTNNQVSESVRDIACRTTTILHVHIGTPNKDVGRCQVVYGVVRVHADVIRQSEEGLKRGQLPLKRRNLRLQGGDT